LPGWSGENFAVFAAVVNFVFVAATLGLPAPALFQAAGPLQFFGDNPARRRVPTSLAAGRDRRSEEARRLRANQERSHAIPSTGAESHSHFLLRISI